jgi:hypothetical protein
MKIIPNYHPPSDYRRPTKTQEKVYVPVNDYPEINFSMITNPLTPFVLIVAVLSSLCNTVARFARLAILRYVPSTNTNCLFLLRSHID